LNRLGIMLSPTQRRSRSKGDDKLFKSGRIGTQVKKENGVNDKGKDKLSKKVVTTDESNNGVDSKLKESIFLKDHNAPNEEYFH